MIRWKNTNAPGTKQTTLINANNHHKNVKLQNIATTNSKLKPLLGRFKTIKNNMYFKQYVILMTLLAVTHVKAANFGFSDFINAILNMQLAVVSLLVCFVMSIIWQIVMT